MDTLLILRDTLSHAVILTDAITAHVVKVVDNCQPCVQEAETNRQDVAIVFLICATIVVIALITKCTVLSWKSKGIKAEENQRKFQQENEKIESERKQAADDKNRSNLLIDEERKHKYAHEEEERKKNADLLEKKLQILKELCYAINDGDKQLKAYGDDIKRFFNVINSERGVPYDNDETTSDQHKDQETSSGQQQTDTNPNI